MRRRPGRTSRRASLEFLALEGRRLPTTFMVTTALDDGSPGSLRDAISAADQDTGTGPTVIDFAIPGTGVETITPLSPLPAITHPMTVDGYSQPGSSPNTSTTTDNAVILIEINGSMAGPDVDGLSIGGGVTIQGLAIDDFTSHGIELNEQGTPAPTPSAVQGCFLGTNPSGASGVGNGEGGISLNGGENVVIGGDSPADRNVIAGNTGDGVYLLESGADLAGNFIGIGPLGTALGNSADGVEVDTSSGAVEVGDANPGGGNVISGNQDSGVAFHGSAGGLVQGNLIGLGPDGETAIPNLVDGVALFEATTFTTVGGAQAADRNIISGNGDAAHQTEGVAIIGTGTTENSVIGNYIGTDFTGEKAVPNAGGGVIIFGGAAANAIGTNAPGTGNVISGNDGSGVLISDSGTDSNSVLGDLIGFDANRSLALGNTAYGVDIQNQAEGNAVGYSPSTVGSSTISNTIVFNGSSGVVIAGTGTNGNIVSLNAIVDNSGSGVGIFGGASHNLIGGAPLGNVISGSTSEGVSISGSGTSINVLIGNQISDNAVAGVELYDSAVANFIGEPGEPANVITSSAGPGVLIQDSQTQGNFVDNNLIGGSATASTNDNAGPGVLIEGGATGNQVGGSAAEANIITHNNGPGIAILTGTFNTILSNSIYGNLGIPIDLGGDSETDTTTANIAGGTHSGANDLLNYPILSAATQYGAGKTISGSLNAVASTTYIIQIFGDASTDADHAAGSTYLGQTTVTTNSSGNAIFSISFASVGGARSFSATATADFQGTTFDTSEYSTELVPPPPPTLGDYDGDGKADPAVYDPSTGVWTIDESTAGTKTTTFGEANVDIPVPGDYDGDGKTDLAVYRPTTGQWIIQRSTAGPEVITFGGGNDIPVPGDYFGDGKTDLAVYNPSTAQWLIYEPGVAGEMISFGTPNVDTPVPADYFGDGKTDLALYNSSIGQWLIYEPGVTGKVVNFGEAGVDKPVPADYDGDGKADLAVFRPTTDQWIIMQSSGGGKTVQFGEVGVDIPVPEDYDGDGKADIAVFRPTTAQWLILRSTAGPEVITVGQPNADVALAAADSYRYLGSLETVSAEAISPYLETDPTEIFDAFVAKKHVN